MLGNWDEEKLLEKKSKKKKWMVLRVNGVWHGGNWEKCIGVENDQINLWMNWKIASKSIDAVCRPFSLKIPFPFKNGHTKAISQLCGFSLQCTETPSKEKFQREKNPSHSLDIFPQTEIETIVKASHFCVWGGANPRRKVVRNTREQWRIIIDPIDI